MNKSIRFFILLVLLFAASRVSSQTNGTLGSRFFSNWSISLSGGPNIFFGDLKEFRFLPATSPVNEIRFAGTLSLNRQLSHVFMLRAQFLWGGLAGEKVKYKDGSLCNQYFESTLFELNLNTTINFSNLILRYNPKRFFFVYGTVGVGMSDWITKTRDITTKEIIRRDGSWSTINPHLVIPAGLGAYFSIKDKVNLGLEWTIRALAIDRLDATVGGYPYDMYSLFAFNITYNFNKPSNNKLSPASPQKQIGPPPPQPLLAAEIAAEKQKEQAAKEQASYPRLTPPSPSQDSVHPKQPVLTPYTTASEEILPDTNIMDTPVKGISYRVQVFAFKENTFSAEQVKEKLRLSQDVVKEFSGGWYRYTVSSFTDFNKAKKLMNDLRATKEVPDAFVAKYINGKRAGTTTQKALKNSKSYKGKIYYRNPARKK